MGPSIQTMGFFMSDIDFCNTKEQLNHLGEVVTGKTNGSPSGSDISTSTLPYTGQVRKTLPALEDEYQADIDNFVQVSNQVIIDKSADFDTSIANKEAEADAVIDTYRLNSKGDYAPGILLSSKFEYITYNGESYFATNPPYTTTATLPDVDSNLFIGGYLSSGDNSIGSKYTSLNVYPLKGDLIVNDSIPTNYDAVSLTSGVYETYDFNGVVSVIDEAAGRMVIGGNTVYGKKLDAKSRSVQGLRVANVVKKMQNGDAVKIVCLGDSITFGDGVDSATQSYPVRLQEMLRLQYRNNLITVVNAGVSGNTASQMVARFETDVASQNPDAVIILVGMNDLRTRTLEQYKRDTTMLFAACENRGYGVVACDITPRWRTTNSGVLDQQRYRTALYSVVEDFGLNFVPLYDLLLGLLNCKRPYRLIDLTYDGTHYKQDGYYEIAGAIFSHSGLMPYKASYTSGGLIEPSSPLISVGALSTVTFTENDAFNQSRLKYLQGDTGVDGSMSIQFWMDDYDCEFLVSYLSNNTYGATNPSPAPLALKARNKRDQTVSEFNELTLSEVLAGTASPVTTSFAIPYVIAKLKPGWNDISISAIFNGNSFQCDGFRIKSIPTKALYMETYQKDGESIARDKGLIKDQIANAIGNEIVIVPGNQALLADLERPLINKGSDIARAYVWYMSMNRTGGGSTKIKLAQTRETNNDYGSSIEISMFFTTVWNMRAFRKYRDGSSIIDAEYLDFANGYLGGIPDGTMVRFAINFTDNKIYLAHGSTRQLVEIKTDLPSGSLIIENNSSQPVSTSKVWDYTPTYMIGAGLGVPVDGEEFLDATNNKKVIALRSAFKSISLT